MRKPIILLAFYLLIFVSCNKRDISTPSGRLIGHWENLHGNQYYFGKTNEANTGSFIYQKNQNAKPLQLRYMIIREGKQVGVTPKWDFTLKSIDDKEITLSNLKGKVILIDFWATWCPPCQISIPIFIDLYEKYHEKGFMVLGISREDKSHLEDFRDTVGIPYPILIDNKGISNKYQVQAIPTIVIYDKVGNIRKTHIGIIPELESFIVALLKEDFSSEDAIEIGIPKFPIISYPGEKQEVRLYLSNNDLVIKGNIMPGVSELYYVDSKTEP